MKVYVVLADYTGEFLAVFSSPGEAKKKAKKEGRAYVKEEEIASQETKG